MKNKFYCFFIFIIILVSLSYKYSLENLDKIYVQKAEKYYQDGDVLNAQKYYEKAFEKGFNGSEARENYINSLINSPVTIDTQEKLDKFLKQSKDDSANLKAKFLIEDIKNLIEEKYNGNYISNAVYNQKIMRWSNLPIKYSFTNTENVPTYFIQEINNAFQEWESSTENQIAFIEDNKNPNIIINFYASNPTENKKDKYIVAYTVPETELDKLKKMVINFYLRDIQNNYFSQNQVYNTALHEIAHAIGFMGHSIDKNNIMYLTKDSETVFNDYREQLTLADINTIKLLYKIKPQITNTNNPSGEYAPIVVLGSNKEVNNEKFEEALIYIKKAPNLPAGYIDLAESYLIANQYDLAIEALTKALKVAETEEIKAMIYYNFAVIYYQLKEFDRAYKLLKYSISTADSDEKRYLLGTIFLKQNKIKEAIYEYTQLIHKNPDNIEYTIALTNIYINQKNYIKARKIISQFIKNNPEEINNPKLTSYGFLKLGL